MNDKPTNQKRNLTQKYIRSLKPKKKQYEVRDTNIRGLAVRVAPSGHKSLTLRYLHGGKQMRYKLCDFLPNMTMEEIYDLVKECHCKISRGIDIQAERKEKKQEEQKRHMTVKDICEKYMSEGCLRNALSTQGLNNIRIRCHIIPMVGSKTLQDLKKADVERMIRDIAEGKTAEYAKRINPDSKVSGGETTARDCAKLLRIILNYGIDRGYITDNATSKIKLSKNTESSGRYYSDKELARLFKELQKSEEYGLAVYIIHLLLLTGCRRNEIQALKWDDVDLENKRINLSDSKTGKRTIYLATPAVKILREQQTSNQGRYVFPSPRKKDTHYKSVNKQWERMREEAKLVKPNIRCRIHDLRHTYLSLANEIGYPEPTTKALAGHSSKSSITANYIHPSVKSLSRAAEEIVNVISKQLQDQKTIPIYIPIDEQIFRSATEETVNIMGDKLQNQGLKKTVPTYDLDSAIKQLGPKDGLIANETVFYVVEGSALDTARIYTDFKTDEEES